MENWIDSAAAGLAIACEGLAVFIIGYAILEGLYSLFALKFRKGTRSPGGKATRIQLGWRLSLALEFLLASDILRTAVAPTWNELAKLGTIVVIRTALNYFLEREIEFDSRNAPTQAAKAA